MASGKKKTKTIKSAGAEVARALILEFEDSEPKSQEQEMTKWAMGNAISEVATPAFVQDLLRLARDKRHGAARQMLAIAIGKKGKKSRKESIDVLVELLDDPDLQGQALAGLGYLKAKEARKSIEPFLDHDNAWIRKEAKKALRKCED